MVLPLGSTDFDKLGCHKKKMEQFHNTKIDPHPQVGRGLDLKATHIYLQNLL